MAEAVQILTNTVAVSTETAISIISSYVDDAFLDLYKVEIADSVGSMEAVSFLEGEGLAYFLTNTLEDVQISNGDLLIDSSNSDNYSINDDGDLIYTE